MSGGTVTTAQEIEATYQGVASASRELGVPTQTTYRWLQIGRLEGVCVDGGWLVARASVAKLKRERNA